MNKETFSIIVKCIGKIRINSKYTVAAAVVITTIAYVMSPSLFGDGYIKAPPRTIVLKLPKQFQTCDLKFRKKIFVQSYGISPKLKQPLGESIKISRQSVRKEVESLEIHNRYDKTRAPGVIEGYTISVYFKTVFPIEIIGVSVDGSTQELKTFFENNIALQGISYVDNEYIREDISAFLLLYNDPVSNYLLTAMFISLIPMVAYMLRLLMRAYLYTDKRFLKYISQGFDLAETCTKKDAARAAGKYANYYVRQDSWFHFTQIMGPAVGFTLTVASLIAALHPITENTNDISGFMAGMHIAMISTLLGLIVRIIGTVSQRVNDKLLSRADDAFSAVEDTQKQEGGFDPVI
ncbi:MAG: MotA/TolQ/ExbB proton channel family protein [Candidatus Methanospirareceae archaeon]